MINTLTLNLKGNTYDGDSSGRNLSANVSEYISYNLILEYIGRNFEMKVYFLKVFVSQRHYHDYAHT